MADKQKKDNFFKRIASYFKAIKSEVKKVTWPSKKQVINNTGIVIACIAVVGIFIFILDAIFGFGFGFLTNSKSDIVIVDPTEVVEDATEPVVEVELVTEEATIVE